MPAIASNRPPDFQMEGLWAALGRLDRMLERAANEGLPRYGSKSYISHSHLTFWRSMRLENKRRYA